MDPNAQYMEGFIQRFRQLEAHKDLSNSLIRDILTYCDQLEQRNAQLVQQQNDDKLELDDARRSRRELQRELGLANQTIDRYNISYDLFRVGKRMMADAAHPTNPLQNRNPYVMVLIDGDGMIVSVPCFVRSISAIGDG
jgi:hypothetical protein